MTLPPPGPGLGLGGLGGGSGAKTILQKQQAASKTKKKIYARPPKGARTVVFAAEGKNEAQRAKKLSDSGI